MTYNYHVCLKLIYLRWNDVIFGIVNTDPVEQCGIEFPEINESGSFDFGGCGDDGFVSGLVPFLVHYNVSEFCKRL